VQELVELKPFSMVLLAISQIARLTIVDLICG